MRNTILIVIFLLVFIWSGISPHDYITWFLEVFPCIFAFVILLATYKKFPLTTLTYTLILIHCIILCVGGKYTYAEVPLFKWIQEYFGHARNNYDKIGHIAQGFIPAIIVREVFVRKQVVASGASATGKKGAWLFVIIVFFCTGISAMYELLEWGVAELSGEGADAFLGT